ncbi:hypothetical protein HQQ94_11370 [Shewanella sp. VB17]|uniref:hypothetical protein n=1 Tax=Shewanella sp. VB17 TaxID=2739432 RepID=UPI001567961C|nr:hypothetical protein [Shewanella sp. VB17]NRD73826.1 hypothetical protein [Shewanella sp. VB17]
MKLVKLVKLVSLLSLLVASSSYARTSCPKDKIVHLQIESNHVLYSQDVNGKLWRRLGSLSEPGTRERYSALLAAQMSGKEVVVAYSDNAYDCSLTNYKVSAYLVRTFN